MTIKLNGMVSCPLMQVGFSWYSSWRPLKSSLQPLLKKVATDVLAEFVPAHAQGELSIALVDDATIHKLNAQYRDKNQPTNVLSFGEGLSALTPEDWKVYQVLGDVILAHETIQREAIAQKKTFQNHVIHLLIHGILHVLGYDHETDEEATHMESLEIMFLKRWGIPNPYNEVE